MYFTLPVSCLLFLLLPLPGIYIYHGSACDLGFSIRSFVMQNYPFLFYPFFFCFFFYFYALDRTCFDWSLWMQDNVSFVSFPDRLVVWPHLLYYLTVYTNTIRSVYLRVDYGFYFLRFPVQRKRTEVSSGSCLHYLDVSGRKSTSTPYGFLGLFSNWVPRVVITIARVSKSGALYF